MFFTSGGGARFAWDPTEITGPEGQEYRFYQFNIPEPEPIFIADSFWAFLEVRQSWDWEDWPSQPEIIRFKPNIIRRKKRLTTAELKPVKLWNTGTVMQLARNIRETGQTDLFPILADALQEAGCTNADLLDSCRTGDPDIDGVWVLQVLLGKA